MDDLFEPYLSDMWLLDQLVKKDYRRALLLKLLDNGDVVVTLSRFLDIRSLTDLLSINKKAQSILRLAVIEVRLLKEKIKVMENLNLKRQGFARRLEMIEHYRNLTPILKLHGKSKLQNPQQTSNKQQKKQLNANTKATTTDSAPPQVEKVPEKPAKQDLKAQILQANKFEQLYHPAEIVIDDHKESQNRMVDFLLYKMESSARQKAISKIEKQYYEEVTKDPLKSHLKPGVDKLRSLYKWARRQYGITLFRDPQF